MSVSEAKNPKENASGNNSDSNLTPWKGEMTRAQALAVAWEALAVLANNGQARFFNDVKKDKLVIHIANARVDVTPATKTRKRRVNLLDLESANGSIALAVGQATDGDPA